MAKKEKNLLFQQPKRWGQLAAAAIILVCILSDFITVYSYTPLVYNENELISVMVALVLAICLDASLAYAASLLNQRVHGKNLRRIVGVVSLIGVFLLAFGGLLLLVVAATQAQEQDLFTTGAYTRLLLPLATSALSFIIGLSLDPPKDEAERLEMQAMQLRLEISKQRADCERLQNAFCRFDPCTYDRIAYQIAVKQLEAVRLCAELELGMEMAQEFETADVTQQLLKNDHDIEALRQELIRIGDSIDTSPAPNGETMALAALEERR